MRVGEIEKPRPTSVATSICCSNGNSMCLELQQNAPRGQDALSAYSKTDGERERGEHVLRKSEENSKPFERFWHVPVKKSKVVDDFYFTY